VNCRDLLQRIAQYGDSDLPAEVCAEIEQHLHECADCEDVQRELQAVSRLCRRCSTPRLPDDVRQRIERLLKG